MPHSDDLRELLLTAELITESSRPNSSHQYLVNCFECDSRKMYIDAGDDEDKVGLAFCQKCSAHANYKQLVQKFGPQTEEQKVYAIFHEYAVRQLLKNKSALKGLIDERDFTEEDIATFGYGYVGKDFIKDLAAKGVTLAQLKEHGFYTEKDGKWYPVFWNHVIIPYRRNGKYENFKGRNLDENARIKYIGLSGKEAQIYGESDLHKAGRKYLTEGEFKRDYATANGYNCSGISGAGNAGKFIKRLRMVDDLWIVLDADAPTEKFPLGCGQENAIKIAEQLDKCHVVFLPLLDGKKTGLDDYLRINSPDEFDELCEGAEYYAGGEKQKSQSLAVIVQDWKRQAKSITESTGLDIGFPRLNEVLHGAMPGSLAYAIGAPHNGKTALLRAIALNTYRFNENCHIKYYTNDDSLKTTIGHVVAMIGELNSTDAKEPMVAYANNKQMMRQWEQATRELEAMSNRFTLLDRGYKVSLEDIREDLMRWREKNPDGEHAVFIDGFSKIYSVAASKVDNERQQLNIKSDFLKQMAQQADVFVMSTIEPPKLYGRRPQSFDIANSAMGEFDADIVMSCYIDALVNSIEGTELKQVVEYSDETVDTLPIIEVKVHKNKQTGNQLLDLFILHKGTSTLEELEDTDYNRMSKKVVASQLGTKKQ